MKTELIKLNASEYGIEKSKAKQLEKVFVPMVEKFKELEKEYTDVLESKEITKDVCSEAKTVRNKYVKVRTGADAIHKIAKEKILIESRAIDGLRNIIKYAVTDHEESLLKVEKHFERLEAEKLNKIREERTAELAKYNTNPGIGDIAGMNEDVWSAFIAGTKMNYDNQIAAEKKIEADRLAKIEADRIEQERIRKENEQLKKEAEERERLADIERKRLAKIETARKAKEEKERKERQAKEAKAEAGRQRLAKIEQDKIEQLKKEIEAKEAKERQDKIDEENRIQSELNKGDSEKVKDLINDLNGLKTKYSFTSKKNQKMYSDVNLLIDKVINHIG